MISWIQDQLARNGKPIIIILLIAVIVPFVFVIGNTPGLPGAERSGPGQDFYGVNLQDRDVAQEWITDTTLGIQMEMGRPPFNEQMVRFMALNRVGLIYLADELGIPEPGVREVQAYVPELALFQKPDGSFDNSAYLEFIEMAESNPQLTEGDIERALRKSYRVAQVTELINGQGFTLDFEAELALMLENTTYDIEVAEFPKDDFAPEIEVTEEALKTYFDNNQARYEIAEKVESAWVRFSVEETAKDLEIQATEEALQTHFDENKTTYIASKAGEIAEADLTLADVREAVEADYLEAAKNDRATRVVEEKASALAYDIFDQEAAFGSDEFNAILETYGVTLENLPAVQASAPSVRLGRDMPRDLVTTLFSMSGDKFTTDPLRLNNGDMGVFFVKGKIPAEIPEFTTVEARVRSDFESAEKDRLFSAKGAELAELFKTAVEAGTPFADAVYASDLVPSIKTLKESFLDGSSLEELADKEASVLTEFEAVKSSERRDGLETVITSSLAGMSAGDVSQMLTSGSTGYFVYVASVTEPEEAAEEETLIARAEQFENRMARTLGQAVMEELISAGAPEAQQ